MRSGSVVGVYVCGKERGRQSIGQTHTHIHTPRVFDTLQLCHATQSIDARAHVLRLVVMSLRSGLASSPGTTLDSVPPGCCGGLGRGDDGGGGGAFRVLRTQSGKLDRSIL